MLLITKEHSEQRQASCGRIDPIGVNLETNASPFECLDRVFHTGKCRRQATHVFAFDQISFAIIEGHILKPLFKQLGPHFLFGLHVVGLVFTFDPEQRRLSHIDMPRFDQLIHLTIEEAQQQRTNV